MIALSDHSLIHMAAGIVGECGILQANGRPRMPRKMFLYQFAGNVTSQFQDQDLSARTHLQTALSVALPVETKWNAEDELEIGNMSSETILLPMTI